MGDLPKYGKVNRDFFEKVIYPNLGTKRNEVLAGPSFGVDNCVIKVGRDQVLVATTDPLSYIEELGPEDSAWLSVHSIASDIATSGFHPQYVIFDLNLPVSFGSLEFERYWSALSSESGRLGIAIVGGHTGRFEGIDSTIVGAGTMFSIGRSKEYLTSAGAVEDDALIVTKGAAIETTGVLARVFPNKIREKIGERRLRTAQRYFKRISVVEDAFTAIKVGLKAEGVSAMHDATEGGVLSGLSELARASSLGMLVERDKIPVSSETKEICELFEIDPYTSLSEGTLVFSCNPSKAKKALEALGRKRIEAAVVGRLVSPKEGLYVVEKNGEAKSFDYPLADPYWNAYYKAKRKKWT